MLTQKELHLTRSMSKSFNFLRVRLDLWILENYTLSDYIDFLRECSFKGDEV